MFPKPSLVPSQATKNKRISQCVRQTAFTILLGIRLKNPLTDNYLQKKVATCEYFTTFALI
jgi:hypothetical protein